MGTAGSEKGGAYAGEDHEAEHSALRHDIHGMYRWPWDAGNKPYLQKNDPKYTAITESQRKMAEPVEVKGQALASDEPILYGIRHCFVHFFWDCLFFSTADWDTGKDCLCFIFI